MKYDLVDICDDYFWIMPQTPEYVLDSEVPYITSKNIKNGKIDFAKVNYIPYEVYKTLSSNREIREGDLLISMIGTIGEVAIVKQVDLPFYGQNVFLLRINQDKFDLRFVYHFLTSLPTKDILFSRKKTGTQSYLKYNDIVSLKIPYYGREKQIKIVEELDELFLLEAFYNDEIKKLNDLIHSQFLLYTSDNKTKNFLGNFAKPYTAERCGNRELPILSITKEFGIILQDDKFKKRIASVDTSKYKIVPKNILVQGIHIDEKNFGVQQIVEYGIVSPAYKLWKLSGCNERMVEYAMRTDETMNYIKSKFTGSIKRREKISNKDLLATPLNLPSLEKQNEFIALVDEITAIIEKIKFQIELINELKRKKMDEYFK